MKKKKSDFRCRLPKTDFRFLIYTPKNIYLKKILAYDEEILQCIFIYLEEKLDVPMQEKEFPSKDLLV